MFVKSDSKSYTCAINARMEKDVGNVHYPYITVFMSLFWDVVGYVGFMRGNAGLKINIFLKHVLSIPTKMFI